MAPPRLVFLLVSGLTLTLCLTFVSLVRSHPRRYAATASSISTEHSSFRSFFSFRTPSALFPSSAIISLTDDNSTFFLARPADFGPHLPPDGLSGQLWVGSGFGDDSLGRGLAADTEGELGCSDVPGWRDGRNYHQGDGRFEPSEQTEVAKSIDSTSVPAVSEHSENQVQDLSPRRDLQGNNRDDGTDDHLHHPLPSSQLAQSGKSGQGTDAQQSSFRQPPQHADIQSLQEGAEISGKLVLLSRGGCGFLEKVKWVQRRGGAGLIVGDNTRGGALVTMYAKGDTSNVTIPALFTSRTTAHLLSSLIPPEAPDDDNDIRSDGAAAEAHIPTAASNADSSVDRPTFTPTALNSKPTSPLPGKSHARRSRNPATNQSRTNNNRQSWMSSLFGWKAKQKTDSSEDGAEADSRRPPSSGRLTWVNEEWTESAITSIKGPSKSSQGRVQGNALKQNDIYAADAHTSSGDGFEIGVHDWRDPDLVGARAARSSVSSTSRTSTRVPTATALNRKGNVLDNGGRLSGGSITPGSGEYQKPASAAGSHHKALKGSHFISEKEDDKPRGWFGKLLWGSKIDQETSSINQLQASVRKGSGNDLALDKDRKIVEHEGLWITLTPTTMSTSPFFDTLLVLVVSPLITLTVVYSLLLIRSRIRRRRWRAPKSVVDRLPIRTYHTMSCSSTTSSSQLGTPRVSSPTSPLLQHSPQSLISRSRPRSRTASGIGDAITESLDKATAKVSMKQEETNTKPDAKKRQYHGKQIECVVCLEEYVDGQSKVMSLPCGHEFHAECM